MFRLFCKTSISFTGYKVGFPFVVVSIYQKKPTMQGASVSCPHGVNTLKTDMSQSDAAFGKKIFTSDVEIRGYNT